MSRSKEPSGAPKRIDVASTTPALSQNPFAKLAGVVVPATPASSAAPAAAAAAAPAAAASAGATERQRAAPAAAAKGVRGRLLLRRETKHRGGKAVILIGGFSALRDHNDARLGELEKLLKQRLGCGGSLDLDKREILIQGDRPEEVAALLRSLSYDVGGVTSRPQR